MVLGCFFLFKLFFNLKTLCTLVFLICILLLMIRTNLKNIIATSYNFLSFLGRRYPLILIWIAFIFFFRKEIIFFIDLFSTEVFAEVSDRETDRIKFCKSNCPVKEPMPANYPRCRPLGSDDVFYASRIYACWTICRPEMVVSVSKVAWWEFWVKAPSADEINAFAKKALINASKCLENGYTGEIESRKGTLAAYLNDFMHDWGLVFVSCIFGFALLITIIAAWLKAN